MQHKPTRASALAVLACLLILPARLQATVPDLTAAGVLVDTTFTYNLGPTGARGWIYSTGNEWLFTPEGLTTESRQILVTAVDAGSPAAGILLVDDVILGASGTAAAPVAFASDARKSLGLAIGEAEKAANGGVLKLLIWRGGGTQTVQLPLEVMGTYSATAPAGCPKSTAIITKACTLLASHSINSGYTEGNAVIGLALLACASSGDPYYATVRSKVETYARSVASQNLDLTIPVNQMVAWPWGYNNVFLSEYYLATGDSQVLPAIRELTATCATGQSLFGTYGHGMAWSKSDGSSTHGYVPPYGALNQAGETVNLGIMLGRKALVAAGELATLDPEIDPAIERARKYFAYFAGKGAVPYGHSPPEDLHDDNGKNGLATLLMALQGQADMSAQARQFAKSCTAAYNLREMGHCGPYWAHLWQPLGVNIGGPTAMAAYFQQIQWELDLARRWDGGFAYHGPTGATAGATGLGADSDTACFLLTYATALKKLYITGRDQSSSNYVAAADVTEAITDGVYSLRTDLDSMTSDQLVACLSGWSPQKRNWAAAELATRSDAGTKVATLLTMAADLTNLNARKGACQTLGQLKSKMTTAQQASAAGVLRDRLSDSDYHVRYYAAEALRAMGTAAASVLNDMLTKIASVPAAEPIDWNDPYQMANISLGSAAFEGQLGSSVASVSTGLLYPAITALSRSLARGTMANTFSNALSLANVQALAPVVISGVLDNHTICEAGLANACVSVLSKYNIDEGIPAAMTFLNQEYGRAWPTSQSTCETALRKYGATAAATLPALAYWNSNGVDLATTIATIQSDTSSHALVYFKTIGTCGAAASTVALPLATTTLSAAASDIDGNGASLVYTWSKLRGAGGVSFGPNGTTASSSTTVSFDTPGTYLIRLGVTDGVLDPNKYGPVTRDLTIVVSADPNRPPVAANQSVTTPLNTAKAITLAGTDADGNALTCSVVSNPVDGALTGSAPNLTYTPAAGFTGTTSFTYKASDGMLDSSLATVTIAVGTSGNTKPVANNQAVTATEDTAKAITLTGSDADAGTTLTYAVASQPAHGTLTGTAPVLTYTPASNHSGTDSFTFTVSDGTATSSAATVAIQIPGVNDAPLATAQSLNTVENTAIPITLTGTDPEGHAITYQLTGAPAHGTLSGVVPNLTYTPTALYNGSDSFTFTVTDSEGVVSATATVSLTVSAVNQAPLALNRSLPVAVGTATAVVLDGTDADNNPLTYTVLSQPLHGNLTGVAPNLTYTPQAGYNSRDSFTFKVNDGSADSNIATVYFSMGVTTAQVYTECYLWTGGVPNPWPEVSSVTPDATRLDADLNIGNTEWPSYFEDHFSSRHTGYINVPTAGNYTFISSADDNTKVWIDEALVIEQTFPNAGTSPALHLTTGYHSVRLEFVEGYGENHFTLYWKGPGISQQVVPASKLFHCTGSTAPVEPANLSATALDGAVALAWAASPFATSYTLLRGTAAGGPYTALPAVLTTTSFRDTSVTNGTTYYYVVTATGSGGTSFNSNEAGATPVAAPVTVNLDYHPSSAIYMNGTASNSAADSGTASRVAPLDYDGTNAAATAVNFWNTGGDGNAALTNMKNSEGVATSIGVTAVLAGHGSSSTLSALGGNRLLKGGVTLTQANLPGFTPLIKLTGLSTAHVYQLALACQNAAADSSTTFRVGAVQQTAANGSAASDWRSGLNHALLDGLIPNAAGEIHLQAMVNTSSTAALNGWQLLDKGVRSAGANSYTTIDSCSFGALGAATITDSNIAITVPYGTAIGALTPTFVAAAGATLSPITAQNFASPVTYRVTAENGVNYQDYFVTVIVAPDVTFTTTAPAITAAATGSEILSTGTLVAANHGGSTAVAPVTLANGLVFGISTEHLTSGWGGSHQRTDTDAHGKVPLLDGSTAFGRFMRSYMWSSSTYYYLDIPGLTSGHTYRLQLISPNPAGCKVAVDAAAAVTWAGTSPSLLTATWTAKDTVANIVLTRTGGEIVFHGYALHDVTPGFQPAPTGLAATAGDGRITLAWAAAPGAIGYAVKRGTASGGPYTTVGTAGSPAYQDSNLSNGVRYYYVVAATTALGDTPNSVQASAVPVAPAMPPAAPANLVATPGNHTVGLSWALADTATGYNVKRATTNGGPYATLGSPSATSYTDATAVNGTTYYYVVSATNGAGEGTNSGQVAVVPAGVASTTTLTSSPGAGGPYATAVTFTASVTASATGTVTFMDGATVLGAGTLSAGQATFTTSTLAVGTHGLTANYAGDATFAASASTELAYTVSRKLLTISGVVASGKVYDGTTTATLTGGALAGVIDGDTVTLVPGSGDFADPNVGTGKSVTASGYALGGTHAANYILAAQPAGLTATIAARPVVVSGTRVYDGTAAAAAGILSVSNNIDGASLGLTGSANLAAKDVGAQALATVAAAARVQTKTGSTGANAATSFSVTLDGAPATGNTLIAVIATRGTSANRVGSITQTGAIWTRAAQATNTNGSTTEIWYAPNVSGAATGVTIAQASLRSAAVVMEYSGILTTSPLDKSANATGNSGTPATGTTTTTARANELWIGGIGLVSSGYSLSAVQNTFTAVGSAQSSHGTATNNAKVHALEKFVNTTASAYSGGTITSSQWSGAIATFTSATPTTLALTGTAAGNYTLAGLTGSVQVTAKALAVDGLAASGRAYDGTTAVSLTGAAALQAGEAAGTGSAADGKPYTGDALTLGGTATGAFADKHVGNLKPVTVSGTTLTGAQAGNYTLTQPADLTAAITPLPLTVAAVHASKTYDGTTTAAGTPTLTPELAAGDTATALGQAFQDAGAGVGNKVIVPGITLSDGNGGANYALTLTNFTTGTITPAPASLVLGALAATYDGSAKRATATTTPQGLAVNLTYDGAAAAPISPGSYAVVATIVDPNYTGTASGTLVIAGEEADAWQEAHFTAAEIAAGLAADPVDADGDALTNAVEFTLGSDPRACTPQPLALTPAAGNQLTLSFFARRATGAGYGGHTRKYTLEASSDLANPNGWQAVAGFANIVGDDQTVTRSGSNTGSNKFYRLSVHLE